MEANIVVETFSEIASLSFDVI